LRRWTRRLPLSCEAKILGIPHFGPAWLNRLKPFKRLQSN
jgi:hypothetical protein